MQLWPVCRIRIAVMMVQLDSWATPGDVVTGAAIIRWICVCMCMYGYGYVYCMCLCDAFITSGVEGLLVH